MHYQDYCQLVAGWQQLLGRFTDSLRRQVEAIVAANTEELANHFYATMLNDPHASLFLSNEQVKQRLHPSMQRWLISLFAVGNTEGEALESLIRQQEQIGQVHARVDIPVNLVLSGARHLKQRLYGFFAEQLADPALQGQAAIYASDNIDMAMEIMSHAYSLANDRNARTEEAYRLFSLTQNLGSERERQRAALLDWENNLMFAVAAAQDIEALPRLGASEFGLWYHHKAMHAFEGVQEVRAISDTIARIDQSLLPALAGEDRQQAMARLTEIREGTRSIHLLLNGLLERAAGLEAGRDALTKLLNRKFLPVVLNRELEMGRAAGKTFALLMVDIDHFKRINDTHGHEAGDQVLQQMAALLDRNTRGGDYLFRLGGEEFLIVVVDTDAERARLFAERLRRQVEAEDFLVAADTLIEVTVSLGLALHDGHPDYQRLMRSADEALYQAKHGGRNRLVIATP
ncbi:diguanylate cyclase [Halomonas salifodinae]|uniref:diguanylate cyclase n=1 Tax=Halomonas salifodinae TaxID=438745 RepID=UPI00339DF483